MNKKLSIYALALSLLILSVAGVAYAHWTKVIIVKGTVTTGTVCWEWDPDLDPAVTVSDAWEGYGPDMNYWDETFIEAYTLKDIAKAKAEILDEDTYVVTIWNAYPHYAIEVASHLHYCGTVPGKFRWVKVYDDQMVNLEIYDEAGAPNQVQDSAGDWHWVLQNGLNYIKIGDAYRFVVKWTEGNYQMHYCEDYEISFHIACLEDIVQDLDNPDWPTLDEWEYQLIFEYEVINYNEYFVQHPPLPYVPPVA